MQKTEIMAVASSLLLENEYQRAAPELLEAWRVDDGALFEDPYCFVGLAAFNTWGELRDGWIEVQTRLVRAISKRFDATDAKVWDGYLVLVTPSTIPSDETSVLESIRYDTGRLRKLVASVSDLQDPYGINRLLLPLLPLHEEVDRLPEANPLTLLGQILVQRGVSESIATEVLDAYRHAKPILGAIMRVLSPENATNVPKA